MPRTALSVLTLYYLRVTDKDVSVQVKLFNDNNRYKIFKCNDLGFTFITVCYGVYTSGLVHYC